MDKTTISIVISVLALLVSTWSALNSAGVFSSFDLKIYVDGYLLPKTTLNEDVGNTFPIALPLIFANDGNKAGVVEDIILIVKKEGDGSKSTYSPIAEIDFNKYIAGKQAMHADNIIAPNFYPFALGPKETKLKTFVFTIDAGIKDNSLKETKTGRYNVEIYAKISGGDYHRYRDFPVDFDVDRYNSGGGEYMGRINFPYSTFTIEGLSK